MGFQAGGVNLECMDSLNWFGLSELQDDFWSSTTTEYSSNMGQPGSYVHTFIIFKTDP